MASAGPPSQLSLWTGVAVSPTFHPGALDLPGEGALMEELPSQQLSSSERSSSFHLSMGSRVQASLDLLQPPVPVQF